MNTSFRSLEYFGLYLVLVGAILLFVPNLLLGLFGYPPTEEVWIRVLGAIAAGLGYCYWYSGRHAQRAFALASVRARLCVSLVFLGLVLTGMAKPGLLLFGLVDLACAAWTWRALKGRARGFSSAEATVVPTAP